MRRNKISKYLALALIVLFTATACNDWLDVQPRTEEDAERLYKTVDGFKEALAGTYTLMCQPKLYGKEMTFGTVGLLGQEWSAEELKNSQNPRYLITNYKYDEVSVKPYIDSLWTGLYNAIANANELIRFTDKKKDVVGNLYEVIKGEAVAIRAYLHFDIFRLYSDHGKMDSEEKTLPYISLPNPVITELVTNQQFIDYVLEDIEEALTLLQKDPIYTGVGADDPYFANRNFHLNYYAVQGLKARVLQYAGKKDEARKAAEIVIAAQNQKGLFPWVTENAANAGPDVRDRTYSTEQLFALNTIKLVDNIKGMFTDALGGTLYTSRLNTSELFPEGDVRSLNFESISGQNNVFSKFWQRTPVLSVNPLRNRMPMIRISEMYYIAADYYASADPAEALKLLNTLVGPRSIKGEWVLPETDQEKFVRNILLQEYQREFMGEGQLFFFHKMLGTARIATAATKYKLPLPDGETKYRPGINTDGE